MEGMAVDKACISVGAEGGLATLYASSGSRSRKEVEPGNKVSRNAATPAT